MTNTDGFNKAQLVQLIKLFEQQGERFDKKFDPERQCYKQLIQTTKPLHLNNQRHQADVALS